MQLITELTATVFCLVCSKRSGTPLGKMRGLITVKLANEQVNHRTKFQYKDCHFSERCSCFSSKSLKKKRGRMEEEEEGGGEKAEDGCFFSPFFFKKKNSLVSALLSSEARRLRLRGNGCINELLFFLRGHFSPVHSPFSLTPFPSLRRLHQTPHSKFFYPLSCSLAFILHFTGAFGRLQIFYLLQPRRKGISETSPKVCKDVPFHTEKECAANSLKKRLK